MQNQCQDIDSNDGLYEHYRIEVDAKQTLLRIDKYLTNHLPSVTRNEIQIGIKDGLVKVGEELVKPNYKVRPSDVITVKLPNPPRDIEVIPEDIPLNIVYEDKDLMVVNKEAGMVVHPAYSNWSGTLVNALAYHFEKLPEMEGSKGRPGLVHRIDKDTSGLLVIAKSKTAMNSLAKQFYEHSIERIYYALVWGEVKKDKGTINVNLARSEKDRRITVAIEDGSKGRRAITHYKVIRYLRYVTLIQCTLETGRTHQIRAHMKYLGHPLFNDVTYGGNKILKGTPFNKYKAFVGNCFKIMPRQALHAKYLGFYHPVKKEILQFDSLVPEDFAKLIDKWDNYVKHS